MAERGVIVYYESIRVWCQRFGRQVAAEIRRDRPSPANKWHLNEILISILGRKHGLSRAVDANGDVLEILMQSLRNANAAKRFLMKSWGVPRVLVTEKLRSYGVASVTFAPASIIATQGFENQIRGVASTHTTEIKNIGRFNSPRQAQRLLSVHDQAARCCHLNGPEVADPLISS